MMGKLIFATIAAPILAVVIFSLTLDDRQFKGLAKTRGCSLRDRLAEKKNRAPYGCAR